MDVMFQLLLSMVDYNIQLYGVIFTLRNHLSLFRAFQYNCQIKVTIFFIYCMKISLSNISLNLIRIVHIALSVRSQPMLAYPGINLNETANYCFIDLSQYFSL